MIQTVFSPLLFYYPVARPAPDRLRARVNRPGRYGRTNTAQACAVVTSQERGAGTTMRRKHGADTLRLARERGGNQARARFVRHSNEAAAAQKMHTSLRVWSPQKARRECGSGMPGPPRKPVRADDEAAAAQKPVSLYGGKASAHHRPGGMGEIGSDQLVKNQTQTGQKLRWGDGAASRRAGDVIRVS